MDLKTYKTKTLTHRSCHEDDFIYQASIRCFQYAGRSAVSGAFSMHRVQYQVHSVYVECSIRCGHQVRSVCRKCSIRRVQYAVSTDQVRSVCGEECSIRCVQYAASAASGASIRCKHQVRSVCRERRDYSERLPMWSKMNVVGYDCIQGASCIQEGGGQSIINEP